MSEQEIYNKLLEKVNKIKPNIDDCIYYINEFNSNIKEALEIDKNNFYGNSIELIKKDLIDKKDKLKQEIIPEIENKIML